MSLQWYNRMLLTHPIITKTLSTGVIISMGDIVSQLFDHFRSASTSQKEPTSSSSFSWDHIRTAKMFTWGLVVGPSLHGWYLLLERMFPAIAATASRRQRIVQAVKKLTTDQLAFAPLSIAAFLTYMGTIEGQDWQTETKPKISKEWLPTLLMNYSIWPLVQLINFSLVPLHHQVNLVNVVAVFWNAYLSEVQHRDKIKVREKIE